MAQAHTAHDAGKYYIPHGSKWPIVGSVSLFTTMLGAAALLNGVSLAPWLLAAGLLAVFYMFYGWFGYRDRRKPARHVQRRRRQVVSAWG
jgi:cytochrome c oxidase subunit 3